MTTLTELRVASNDLTQIPSDSLGRLDTLQVSVAPKLWTRSAVKPATKIIHCNTRVGMSTRCTAIARIDLCSVHGK